MAIIVAILIAVVILFYLYRRRRYNFTSHFTRRRNVIKDLEEEIAELEVTSNNLAEDLEEVKALEQDIKEKINIIRKE